MKRHFAFCFSNLLVVIFSLQNEMKDDKYVCTSRLYTLVNDQLHHWKAEVSRYKALTESLQVTAAFFLHCLLYTSILFFPKMACFSPIGHILLEEKRN